MFSFFTGGNKEEDNFDSDRKEPFLENDLNDLEEEKDGKDEKIEKIEKNLKSSDIPPSYDEATVIGGSTLDIPIYGRLKGERIILASSSPRRKELLKRLGFNNIEVIPSDFPEDLDKNSMAPFEYPLETAIRKAVSVYKHEAETADEDNEPALVIAADTVVVTTEGILEKPLNAVNQYEMLKSLRDSEFPHKVYTAVVCITPMEEPVSPGYVLKTHVEETTIWFDNNISDEFIQAYVSNGEGRDAAGGYKIQGYGALLIKKIEGDYTNVVGLPLRPTLQLIEKTLFHDTSQEE